MTNGKFLVAVNAVYSNEKIVETVHDDQASAEQEFNSRMAKMGNRHVIAEMVFYPPIPASPMWVKLITSA